MRTVGFVGRTTAKGRTASVDGRAARIQIRRSLTGHNRSYRLVIQSSPSYAHPVTDQPRPAARRPRGGIKT